jgi:hypothetical protein
MKRKHNRVSILLSTGISFWFSLFPAFFDFCVLEELDINSPNPSFEKIDRDDQVIILEKKLIALPNLLLIRPLETIILERIPDPFFGIPLLNSKVLVLRC